MSRMVGADVEELRALAAEFSTAASRLRHTAQAIRTGVHGSPWRGSIADMFRVSWDSDHSARLRAAADHLEQAARTLSINATEQEQASASLDGAAGTAIGAILRAPRAGWDVLPIRIGPGFDWPSVLPPRWALPELPVLPRIDFNDLGIGGIQFFRGGAEAIGWLNDVVETAKGKGHDLFEHLSHGNFLSAGLKGIGLGEALAGAVEGIRDGDAAGAMKSVAEGGFTFASAPVSLLWNGLKTELEFFIPLDGDGMDAHLQWMGDQGFSPQQISERYEGVQGFINLGNDNVERHAPWMNDIADKVMQKPAEWLYNVGIRL